MKKIFFCFLLSLVFVTGCSNNSVSTGAGSSNGTISYIEAKEKIINQGAILVDVRTKEEYDENHLDGAVLLPVDEITKEKVASIVNDNDILIVYCKSGVRSSEAVTKLNELGYNNVYNLGAMSNWKE
ncbi:MAG: rhodanese-like domain-containing protein [Bacilli bacterium]|nr:rhodanese-like domain-containing protein [Bacilli bacterium]